MQLTKWAFWVAVAMVGYVYVGYPLMLALWARVRTRRVRKASASAELPPVTIVIAARDEQSRIGARLENLLSLDYPAERQIIVVSDGSTDATHTVVAKYAPDVELVVQPPLGKAMALNAGVARARHDILVFTDARQAFARNTLLHLVRNFADPEVGAVSGELILDCEKQKGRSAASSAAASPQQSSISDGVGSYWRYEKWIRRRESQVASTVGVTGAVYAMRRSCWRSLPAHTLLDDVLAPMRVVLAGKRVVFDPEAVAFDRAAADASVESRRKIRTLAGNYQMAWIEPRLLLPFVNPIWLQYVSHKLGRLLVPYALVVSIVSSAVLVRQSAVYAVVFLGQVALALLAAYGALLDARARRLRPVTARPVLDEQQSGAKRVVNA